MKHVVQVVLCMGLLVVALSSLVMGEVSVAKEFTLPVFDGVPFRPRVSGDFAVALQKDNARSTTGLYVYDLAKNTTHTAYSGNAGWPAISGDLAVWTGSAQGLIGFRTPKDQQPISTGSGNIILINVLTGAYYAPALSTGPATNPVIWSHYVAYDGKGRNVYVLDMNTGIQTRLSKSNNEHRNAGIGPDLVVWEEYDSKRQVHGYRISTGEDLTITDDPGAEHCAPRTDGKTIVWWGNSEGVAAYDVASRTRRLISRDGFYADVYNGIVTYLKHVTGGSAVFGYDLSTSKEFRISSGLSNQGPSIENDRVVWTLGNKIYCAVLKR